MRFQRSSFVTGLTVAMMLLAASTSGVGAGASATIVEPWPEEGALFGAYVDIDAHTGPNRQAAWANFELMSGRQMDVDRQFKKWDEPCVNASDRASADAGHRLLISWTAKRRNGSYETWSRIASGTVDPLIDACAAALAGLGATVEFTFQHEPETNTGLLPGGAGTPAEYQAAYRHVVERMRTQVSNVLYVPIFMAITPRQKKMATWYPGNAWADAVGFDGYNWYGCVNPKGPWVTPTFVFNAAHNFTVSVNKPMVIAEWGTGEDPAVVGRKATWIGALSAMAKTWSNLVEINIYHSARNKHCPRYSDTSPSSLAAFNAMGSDPYFNIRWPGWRVVVGVQRSRRLPT
ncbi:MAG: glycosyl hydrolase [Nocardioides sp.]